MGPEFDAFAACLQVVVLGRLGNYDDIRSLWFQNLHGHVCRMRSTWDRSSADHIYHLPNYISLYIIELGDSTGDNQPSSDLKLLSFIHYNTNKQSPLKLGLTFSELKFST